MKSLNFEFLRPARPELAALSAFAEAYVHPDPASALVKLRTFAEVLTVSIFHDLGLQREKHWNLYDLLGQASFKSAIPRVVLSRLHLLRQNGNDGAHGKEVDTAQALRTLRDAFDVGRWLHLTFDSGDSEGCPRAFEKPPPGGLAGATKGRLKHEKRQALERLATREAEMDRLLAELEEARAQIERAQKTSTELALLLEVGNAQAEALDLDEAATRARLIDEQLLAAGWDLSPGSEEASREHPVPHQPTPSGKGRADYVLWDDDGRPLAVIEAKRAARHPGEGQTQARDYADGLEREHGRRPVIFYTNGYQTWLWDDAQRRPPREVAGFYSKDSLQYLMYQRNESIPWGEMVAEAPISLRMYQQRVLLDLMERFASRQRKALVVMATGTGKTRVAVALADTLVRHKWAKRVLFLCDRRELRKQALGAFKELLPGAPVAVVGRDTAQNRDQRIYLATYPAMMKSYDRFDVGFFDLIIADESHRSIYNHYRELFLYFDALQVGLTATPRKGLIHRNTYEMFDCEDEDPTAYYPLEDAIAEKHLVPPEVQEFTTEFLRRGIHYKELSRKQQRQVEQGEERPELVGYEPGEIDRAVFNKDTNRQILRNLMDNGLRVADGTRLGKTIVFARNHRHAMLLHELFDEMYPQYGGSFCRVIDNYDPRAEQLIDDFKGLGSHPELTVAISVDMLDTGVDVPEIVNLVFAKPVFSYIKFWQMIGRGTRLCPNLFGPGQNKDRFLIFDHWGNFERFGESYQEPRPQRDRSLLERLFEARLDLARAALDHGDGAAFEATVELLVQDLQALPQESIVVRPHFREIRRLAQPETLRAFDAATESYLRSELLPLMRWRPVEDLEASRFDLLMARAEQAKLEGSAALSDRRDAVLNALAELPPNLNPVRAKATALERVRRPDFWDTATFAGLEMAREALRGILRFRRPGRPGPRAKVFDITEDASKLERRRIVPRLEGLELVAYRQRVEAALRELFDTSPVLRKIHAGEPVSAEDLEELRDLVLEQHPDLDIYDLKQQYPDLAGHLDVVIRGLIGLDAAAVNRRFEGFVERHSQLSARQIQFLELLRGHIARYGVIELERLYDPPFATFHPDSLDGLFPEAADELWSIVAKFSPSAN